VGLLRPSCCGGSNDESRATTEATTAATTEAATAATVRRRTMLPNFALLDSNLPDVARLVAAIVQARDAVESRPWSHPQGRTAKEWWAGVLADPRARTPKRRSSEVTKPTRVPSYSQRTDPPVRCRTCWNDSPRRAAVG